MQRNRVQLHGNQLWIVDENGEQASPTVDLRHAEVVVLHRELTALREGGGLPIDWSLVIW
jgi:hypothetical protein